MQAFESLVALLLRREGYWTRTKFNVALTKGEERRIGRPSSPRWELDVVAYKGGDNEVLAVECKSFLDSPGVLFRNGKFEHPNRYKLFTEKTLRDVVLTRLRKQLEVSGACAEQATVRLCLAAGHIANGSDREGLAAHFDSRGWYLFDEGWIRSRLLHAADAAYEDDVAHVVSKMIVRGTD